MNTGRHSARIVIGKSSQRGPNTKTMCRATSRFSYIPRNIQIFSWPYHGKVSFAITITPAFITEIRYFIPYNCYSPRAWCFLLEIVRYEAESYWTRLGHGPLFICPRAPL